MRGDAVDGAAPQPHAVAHRCYAEPMDAMDQPGTVAEGALEQRRARVRRLVESAREARRLALDLRPRWATVVAAMYAVIALTWAVAAVALPRGALGALPIAIMGYAAILAAGAGRLHVGRGWDRRAFGPIAGAFVHAAAGVLGTVAMLGIGLTRDLAVGFALLAFLAMTFGPIPVLLTVGMTRRGALLLVASLLGPALLWWALPTVPGIFDV